MKDDFLNSRLLSRVFHGETMESALLDANEIHRHPSPAILLNRGMFILATCGFLRGYICLFDREK